MERGKGRERKTLISTFENIEVRQVAAVNQKLYANYKDGFVGYGLKKDEFIGECSDVDDIITFKKDGTLMITRLSDKTFVGKNIIHAAVWKKGDERTTYNMIYASPKAGKSFVKRFNVTSITRDKNYSLVKNDEKAKVVYFTTNPNGEAEKVGIQLSPNCTARKKQFDFDFAELDIKGKLSGGNTITKYPIKKVSLLEVGSSTIGGRDIWYDNATGRLNTNERGKHLGQFDTGDKIAVIYKNGSFELTDFELTNRYQQDNILLLQKQDANNVFTAIHYVAEYENYYVKRFVLSDDIPIKKTYSFINESKGSKLVEFTKHPTPFATFTVAKGKKKVKTEEEIALAEFIDVKNWKATGNRLSVNKATKLKMIEKDVDDLKVGDQLEWDF